MVCNFGDTTTATTTTTTTVGTTTTTTTKYCSHYKNSYSFCAKIMFLRWPPLYSLAHDGLRALRRSPEGPGEVATRYPRPGLRLTYWLTPTTALGLSWWPSVSMTSWVWRLGSDPNRRRVHVKIVKHTYGVLRSYYFLTESLVASCRYFLGMTAFIWWFLKDKILSV